jgi:hypothetical protein
MTCPWTTKISKKDNNLHLSQETQGQSLQFAQNKLLNISNTNMGIMQKKLEGM